MSEWYYRSGGRESESFEFDAIVELVAAGQLNREDELRQGTDGVWIAAGSIVGLFPDPEELSDLSDLDFSFEESSAPEPQSQRPTSVEPTPDPTDFELKSTAAPTDSGPADAPAAVAEQPDSETWYYRSLGQELGPMPLAEIIQLAVSGTISADDSVRKGEFGEWMSASAVDVLVPILDAAARVSVAPAAEPQGPAKQPAIASAVDEVPSPITHHPSPITETVDVEDLRDDELDEPPGNEVGDEVASQAPVAVTLEQDRWFCRIDGVEHGPLCYEELSAMAQHGRIGRGNQVRSGEDGGWVPAASIGGLFAEPSPSPVPAAGGGRMPYTPPKPIVSKPSRTRAPRDPLMPKIKEQIVSNWKVLAGVAGAMFVVGMIALFSGGLSGTADSGYLDTLQVIYDKHKALKDRKATPDEWAELVVEAEEIKARIVPVLKKTATAKTPIRQELLWAARDHLVPMLQRYASPEKGGSRKKSTDHEKEFATHLENARKLLSGEPIPGEEADESETDDFDEG